MSEYRQWLLRTGELVFEAASGMWCRDCEGYVTPYPMLDRPVDEWLPPSSRLFVGGGE